MDRAEEENSYRLSAIEHLCSVPAYLLGLGIMMVTNWGWWDLPFVFLWVGLCGWIAIHALRRSPAGWAARTVVIAWPFLAVGVAFALSLLR
jgi:hypothetical protein